MIEKLRDLSQRFDLCCINTGTLGYREPIAITANRIAEAGFKWITPWRQEVDERNPQLAADAIRSAGLKVSSYCRTTYFGGNTTTERKTAIADNTLALEVAATLGASSFVAVVGGLASESTDVEADRQHIRDGLSALMPVIRSTGVRIALEPLHPFYAANRSLLNTIDQAMDWCLELDPKGECFDIAVDAYHVWWDPNLSQSIQRASSRINAFHVCDWLRNTQEPLLDRGMMGDGVIQLQKMRSILESCGYQGLVEVEIFSRDNWWKVDPSEVLRTCADRLRSVC